MILRDLKLAPTRMWLCKLCISKEGSSSDTLNMAMGVSGQEKTPGGQIREVENIDKGVAPREQNRILSRNTPTLTVLVGGGCSQGLLSRIS